MTCETRRMLIGLTVVVALASASAGSYLPLCASVSAQGADLGRAQKASLDSVEAGEARNASAVVKPRNVGEETHRPGRGIGYILRLGRLVREAAVPVGSGVIASLVTLVLVALRRELSLRNRFGYLAGVYEHLWSDETRVDECQTQIHYRRGGRLHTKSSTPHGDWECYILMDRERPDFGLGTFWYNDKHESGLMQIIVRAKDTIHVFPGTLTHERQKVHFYIWRKRQ